MLRDDSSQLLPPATFFIHTEYYFIFYNNNNNNNDILIDNKEHRNITYWFLLDLSNIKFLKIKMSVACFIFP